MQSEAQVRDQGTVCVSYLAFVKVVDDFLVELLFQLPLCRCLEPVPLSEVGCTHVL